MSQVGTAAPVKSRRKPTNDTAPVLRDYSGLTGRSLLKDTLGHQNRQSSTVLGSTSDFDACLTYSPALLWDSSGACRSFRPPQVLRRANPTTHFFLRPDTQREMDVELANLDAIEQFVSPHGPELVKIYFRIVHPGFPILHKNVFLEKHGRSYRELTPIGLGAVYVLALNWWSYSQALSSLPKPDAKELQAKVLRMLIDVHRRPKISDLQGGLVLMQSPDVDSWAMTGHLVAMAQNLGINADCTDWQIPDWERGVRKRVAWALFMQDKWGALVYGRGSHIREDDWDVRPLDTSDFPETAKDDDKEEGSAEIEKGKQTFVQMVSLTQVVADILDSFFTLKAARASRSIGEVLEIAKPIQLQLKAWHAGMPSALSLDETVPMKLSSVGYLHLAYYTAEITLHRAILRCHTTTPNASATSTPIDSNDLHLYAITLRAASARFTSALDFMKRLKAEHFQSFWYFSSSVSLAVIGTFAAVLCTIAPTRADREEYLAKLAEYRWVLRISANSAVFMGYAVGVLDGCSQVLEEQSRVLEQDGLENTVADDTLPEYEGDDTLDWVAESNEGESLRGEHVDGLDEQAFAAFLMDGDTYAAEVQSPGGDWLQGQVHHGFG